MASRNSAGGRRVSPSTRRHVSGTHLKYKYILNVMAQTRIWRPTASRLNWSLRISDMRPTPRCRRPALRIWRRGRILEQDPLRPAYSRISTQDPSSSRRTARASRARRARSKKRRRRRCCTARSSASERSSRRRPTRPRWHRPSRPKRRRTSTSSNSRSGELPLRLLRLGLNVLCRRAARRRPPWRVWHLSDSALHLGRPYGA